MSSLLVAAVLEDPVVRAIASDVRARLGRRTRRIVVYGSRARGEARPDSDYDVAVFLSPFEGFGREMRRLAEIAARIQDDEGAVVSFLPFADEAWDECSAVMRAIRTDGLEI